MPNSIFMEYATTVARIWTGMGRSWAFPLSGTMSPKAGFLGLGSPCSMHQSHCPFIVMMGWIIDCRKSLKGPDGIVWASFFALCIAAWLQCVIVPCAQDRMILFVTLHQSMYQVETHRKCHLLQHSGCDQANHHQNCL